MIGPLNIVDQSYCTTHSFTRTCFTVNLTETARYENLRSLERRKKGKWLSSLSSITIGSVPDTAITDNHETDPRVKGRDLTQSYDNLTTQKIKNPPKTMFTQLFRTDLGRSVGVKTATQLVWLNQFMGSQPSHQRELHVRPNAFFFNLPACSSSFDFCGKF